MFHYVDLIWTGMAVTGGLLLVDGLPDKKSKVGVWLVFSAFVLQVYNELIQAKDWTSVIGTTIILLVGIPLCINKIRNWVSKHIKG